MCVQGYKSYIDAGIGVTVTVYSNPIMNRAMRITSFYAWICLNLHRI